MTRPSSGSHCRPIVRSPIRLWRFASLSGTTVHAIKFLTACQMPDVAMGIMRVALESTGQGLQTRAAQDSAVRGCFPNGRAVLESRSLISPSLSVLMSVPFMRHEGKIRRTISLSSCTTRPGCWPSRSVMIDPELMTG